ncbi:ribulokinase [Pedobacter changchengzhani]|uniref:Ribulokinase n=1 Tax=Pedobacter changchengzhani TaxID=2529274 RepID=A0A4V3A019_9SPHI|nr:ribulokinase [Pedobacter changchengzhani]TDG35703.1 ribulokinase [Pedobacter changchengzhani]
MDTTKYVIGVDYGTDSVRSVLVDTKDGKEISTSVFFYPRWKKGLYCNPAKNQFRQHPLDYIEGIEHTIKDCLLKAGGGAVAKEVKGITIDTTGSTPIAVDGAGLPLALKPEFEENPNAMFVLWKDHTAVAEAREINDHAKKFEINYLKFCGGIYSSEWFWAKLLHVVRTDKVVKAEMISFVEQCDWLPFYLCGGSDVKNLKRSRCAAGHKALWAAEFGGLPPEDFFTSLDPLLNGFRDDSFEKTYTADTSVGNLSAFWADKLGLTTDVIIGIGAFDAHMGAVGAQIEPYYLSKVMGTSTCDILVAPNKDMEGKLVGGICGQVDGSVLPDMAGLEAGQSAFGDVYAWFKNLISWPLNHLLTESAVIDKQTAIALKEEVESKIIAKLSKQAEELGDGDYAELAIDWLNGRRTPDANQELKAAITGLSLGTDAPKFFRALAEATCFGSKSIVDRFRDEGVAVEGIIAIGGVAKKSPYIMQMMSDILEMPIRVHKTEHTCALGAAMFAAVASGIHPTIQDAITAMGAGFEKEYQPNLQKQNMYRQHYQKYLGLGRYIERYNNKDLKQFTL